MVGAGLERDVERRAARPLAGGLERARPRRAATPGPPYQPSPTTSSVRDDDGADQRVRVLDLPAAALRELERPLEGSSPAAGPAAGRRRGSSRRRPRSPATNSGAPASWSSRCSPSPTPPSTWIGIVAGSSSRSRRIRSSRLRHERLARVAGVDAHAEDEVDARLDGRRRGWLDRGLRVERRARPAGRARARAPTTSGQVGADLEVDGDAVGARLGELLEVALGRVDHQVAVEHAARLVHVRRDRLEHDRARS